MHMNGLKRGALGLMVCGVLVSVSGAALAQTDGQKSFEQMKTLSGEWQGKMTTKPDAGMGKDVEGKVFAVSMRTTSSGNAIVHEVKAGGMKDDPVTMLYVDDGRLMLTHYCDAGNRPRMVAKSSADGKTVEFEFVDMTGPTANGHMQRAMFTFIDADHHSEDWTYILPGDKPVIAHFELARVK
jgi:hypothetical protein